MYTVYILHSKSSHKIYIGFTSDLDQRLIAHNHPKNKGWTRKFQPWILVYSENYNLKSEAMSREKQLKTGCGRAFAWGKVEEYILKSSG